MNGQADAGMGDATRSVRVWDVPVRIFHWLLVALIMTSWVTSEIGDDAMTYHRWSGYSILTLVLFRLVWGFVGSRHARFAAFAYGPRSVLGYARELLQLSPPYYAGHNPLGGWSVILMLISVVLQATTGLFANDDAAAEGPLSRLVSASAASLLTTIHRYNFNVLLALIAVHVAAVLFYLIVKRENLIVAMITGRKQVPAQFAATNESMTSPWLAAVVAFVIAGAVAVVVNWR